MRWLGIMLALSSAVTALVVPSENKNTRSFGCWQGVLTSAPKIDAELAELGRQFFQETQLSVDGRVSCQTCHQLEKGYSDGLSRSVGVYGRVGPRNSPSIYNTDRFVTLGWDGEHHNLASVIEGALRNPSEMALDDQEFAHRAASLERKYSLTDVTKVGGSNTRQLVVTAIGEFLKTQVGGDSSVDRFLFLNRVDALSPNQRFGLALFFGKAHCSFCHIVRHPLSSPFGGRTALFTDGRFHNLGLSLSTANGDRGRARISGDQNDDGAFRTPSLRNVALTAPYFHDGSIASLKDVVEFYDRGGGSAPGKSLALRPLGLDAYERNALVEFLQALTSGCAYQGS